MIRIWHRAGRTCPVVVCDICDDMISNAEEGAAVFSCRSKDNLKTNVVHVHKGACQDKAEEQIGDDSGWDELGHHLYLVCSNTAVKYAEETARDQVRRDCGL